MPQFVLDTGAGEDWRKLDTFERGYVEAMFFTETCHDYTTEEWDSEEARTARNEGYVSGSIPDDLGFPDLAPETVEKIKADCARFRALPAWQAWQANDLQVLNTGPGDAQAGRNFWYTRNGHGCGFWDGDWPEPHGAALDGACEAFANVDLVYGKDGKIYFM